MMSFLGHWLCEDKKQCILTGYHVNNDFISNLCDGLQHCKDGSDEKFWQCLQVLNIMNINPN